jgi:hypothetical protein
MDVPLQVRHMSQCKSYTPGTGRVGSVAQQYSVCYAVSAASSAISVDPIVKELSVAILDSGGIIDSILSVRVSGRIPSFLGSLVPGYPASFDVSVEATFRQEECDEEFSIVDYRLHNEGANHEKSPA